MMTALEHGLLQWAGELTGVPDQVHRLTSVLLATGEQSSYGAETRSALNADGSPLQICASYNSRGCGIRILGDPAANVSNPASRLKLSRQALSKTLQSTGSEALAPACEQMFRYALPDPHGTAVLDEEEFRPGFFWIAAGLERGAATYVNTRWGCPEDRWNDSCRWLAEVLPEPLEALALVRSIRSDATLASIGVEGSQPEDARAKLYWRLNRPEAARRTGIALFEHPAVKEYLGAVIGDRSIPLTGIVFSAAFRLVDGGLSDIKIDLCAHCLPRPAAAWTALLEQGVRLCGSPALHVADGLSSGACELALVGIGVNDKERLRLNVYLKAPGDARE